jgi:A/G-specific adenine glycosylase
MKRLTPLNADDPRRLLNWYQVVQRPLPWRLNRDPYRIWISETMLQQTTTTAVIPFFERFMQRFPNLQSLAAASEAEVRAQWAGLGYYSRATNLWRAAQQLAKLSQFPRTHQDLLELPGFGNYTARAVSSLAFGERVGVVDGNVIRVLTRLANWEEEWWKTDVRELLQRRADEWCRSAPPELINQALMELGATICTPKSPQCLLCPLLSSCRGQKARNLTNLPKSRPKRQREFWLWQADVYERRGRVFLTATHELPFLRRHWVLPGSTKRLKSRPRQFDFSHSITHHDIFVVVRRLSTAPRSQKDGQWIARAKISAFAPASLIQKALDF